MAKVIFILGAGASKLAGAPLMPEFLEVADDLYRSNQTGNKTPDFQRVFEARGRLQAVHSKSSLDISNIEVVFNALELARVIGKFPGGDDAYVNKAIASLQEVISFTLEKTIRFPVNGKRVYPPSPYQTFAELIYHLQNDAIPSQTVAVMTFNYDVAVDYALHFNSLRPDYGFGDPVSGNVPLLKLHGSTNWTWCTECETVVPWELNKFFAKHSWQFIDESTKNVLLNVSELFPDFEHCGKPLAPKPFLVPPTWNKADHHKAIEKVWRKAAVELTDAEHIFIIGYSIPETDAFFRLLYSLGTVGPSPLKRLWIFNVDSSGNTERRFRSLVGPGAESIFRYYPESFDSCLSLIKGEFPKERPWI